MGSRKSTCLYLDRRVVETARRLGLNVSRVAENALVGAIGRLQGPRRKPASRAKAALRAGAGIRTRAPGSTGL